jgi:aryl-alcohol dehydrogenase-like predicted oxidoreductase
MPVDPEGRGMPARPATFDIGGETTVDRLGFGAMRLCGPKILGEPGDPEAARDVARAARERGVDLIDTADAYGPGTDERLLSEAIDTAADDLTLATKGGLLRNTDGDWIRHGDPAYLHDAVLSSLDRLGVDTIDLYQLHRPDPDVPIEDSMTALAELQDEGLIRHLGVSNVSVDQLDRASDVATITTVQNRYNVANREHEPVLSACEDRGIGFIPWSPIGGGALEDRREDLETVAETHDATVRQVALAWLLEHSDVTLPIPGTASVEHLEENLGARDLELSRDAMDRLSA